MPTAGAGSCFPAELLEQLKEQLPEALFASLSGTVATTVALQSLPATFHCHAGCTISCNGIEKESPMDITDAACRIS
jgi:hypothetical protein